MPYLMEKLSRQIASYFTKYFAGVKLYFNFNLTHAKYFSQFQFSYGYNFWTQKYIMPYLTEKLSCQIATHFKKHFAGVKLK